MIGIYFIIVGIAAGFIATRVMKIDTDLVTTVVIGLGGAVIGGLALRFLIGLLGLAAGLVGAVIGAIVLIWAYRMYIQKK